LASRPVVRFVFSLAFALFVFNVSYSYYLWFSKGRVVGSYLDRKRRSMSCLGTVLLKL